MSAPFDAPTPPVANAVLVPQLPDRPTSLGAHSLLHLKVGMLNVAYGSAGGGGGGQGIFTPPVNQPLTLPLSLHLHPTLLPAPSPAPAAAAASAAADIDAELAWWTPPGVWRLQRAVLPSILSHLPDMIAQIKVKKMDKLRGNRVGIRRTNDLVFTYAFRETQPAYHVLTVSARRIRQMDQEADTKAKAATGMGATAAASAASSAAASAGASVPPAPLPGSSLSSQLSSFALCDDPGRRVELRPLSSYRAGAGSPDEGFYAGQGFASYLVSKHTLHVRAMPTARALESLRRERVREAERRRAQINPHAALDSHARPDVHDTARATGVGDKRKQQSDSHAAAAPSAAATKKARRHDPFSALDDASGQVATIAGSFPADLDGSEEPSVDELPPQADSDDIDDEWLNMDV